MAIVIKEIILSDTLEKFMEKVNFNFDQLMLAGGGPAGPAGPIGPIGPIGPKGDQGNKWYVGCTGTTSAIGVTLYQGDLFLQKGDCTGSTYNLGDVLEFNQITEVFDFTGLNLRGPTGPAGATGTNTGWAIYPGYTQSSAWAGASAEGSPGATPSFVLLKGDTLGATFSGVEGLFSRDTLYLGGYRGMTFQTSVFPLDKLPKLFVSPKTIIGATGFTDPTNGGVAGSGIALVRELNPATLQPIYPNSYSNIFIDDEMNLNIANFSNYKQAGFVDGSIAPDVNIMSRRGVKLIGAGYEPSLASSLIEVSGDLQTLYATDSDSVFKATAGGFNLYQTNDEGLGQIELRGYTSQLRILANRNTTMTNYPDVAYWSNPATPSSSNTFRIGVGAHQNFKNADFQKSYMPFIGAGWLDNTTDYPYIGLGTKPTGGAKAKLFVTGNKVIIGTPGTYTVADLLSLQPNSIDIGGQLRMRYTSGASGQVMVSVDSIGTAEWVSADQIGAWKNDPSCDRKIEISNKSTRFASFQPGIGNNYTRVDIPTLGAHTSDLYFGNYNETDKTVNQGHVISKSYEGGKGDLSISTIILKPCPSGVSSREAQTGSIERKRLVVGSYGEIVVGSTATNNPNGTGLSKGLSLDSLKIYGFTSETNWGRMKPNIHLIQGGGGLNGQIKFTPYIITGQGTEEGYNSTTSIEILRTYDGSNAGPGNIRFLGLGKSTKTATEDVDNGLVDAGTTTGRGSTTNNFGAHAMMISDAQFKNKFSEEGKTYDYYELNHDDMYVNYVYMTFSPESASLPSDASNDYTHVHGALDEWGTAASGWSSGPWGYNKFNGSRSSNFFGGSSASTPSGFNFNASNVLSPPTIEGAPVSIPEYSFDATKADGLVVWNSPASGVRFSPMNVSNPTTGAGLALVDFNIDIGMIVEVAHNSAYDNQADDGNYTGLIVGPGSGNYSAVKSTLTNGSPVIKYIRVKLDSSNSGLASLLDAVDHTRRKDVSQGNDNTAQLYDIPTKTIGKPSATPQAENQVYHTDWYVGQSKPLFGNLSYDRPWNGFSPLSNGAKRFEDVSWNYGASAHTVRPFLNTITPTWSPPNERINSYGGQAFSDIRWAGLTKSDYSGRYQTANFMWRIVAQYATSGDASPVNSYIEVAFVPDNSSYKAVYYTGDFAFGTPPHNYTVESAGGIMPIMPVLLDENWQSNVKGAAIEKWWDLDYALNHLNRRSEFYTSHGFSLSGQAMIKWNRQHSSWNTTPDTPTGDPAANS